MIRIIKVLDNKCDIKELARRLQCDEKELRRLLDPRYPSKLPRIEAALTALGQKLVVGLFAPKETL